MVLAKFLYFIYLLSKEGFKYSYGKNFKLEIVDHPASLRMFSIGILWIQGWHEDDVMMYVDLLYTKYFVDKILTVFIVN